MIDTNYKAMEVRLRRKAGASPAHKTEMDNFLKAKSDWYSLCKSCGDVIKGLPQDVKSHIENCNEASK